MKKEKQLIDVERRKRVLERFYEHMVEFGNEEAAKATRAIINGLKIEPIVDAVEVTRCKNCQAYDPGCVRPHCGWCSKWNACVNETGFCYRAKPCSEEKSKSGMAAAGRTGGAL